MLQRGIVAAVHLAAAISFMQVLEGWMLALMICALLASSALAIRRLQRQEASVWALYPNGDLSVGESTDARLLRLTGSSTDFGWALWLHWQDAADGRRSAIMFTRDQFDADHWRRMRVWVRHLARVGEGALDRGEPSA